MMNNMMINNMYNNNNIIGMNNMGMNQMDINNQPNLMNGMSMDTTAQNIKNIIQPYENKIKELEEIIRQKDFEITVLKQKLNNNKSNNKNINNPLDFMNMNKQMNMMNNQMNMMNMNIPLNIMIMQNVIQNNEKTIYLELKCDNNTYNIDCYQKDKVSILREKINFDKGKRGFTFNYKVLDENLSFKENGIYDYATIEIKPVLNLFFQFHGKKYSIVLSNDCPLSIAISYFLLKMSNPFILQKIISDIRALTFLYNALNLNVKDQSPIDKIFENFNYVITVVEAGYKK